MKAIEIRSMTDAALGEAIENARQELYNLRFQDAAGRLPNTARLRVVRRDLARLLTVRRQREMQAAAERAAEGKA